MKINDANELKKRLKQEPLETYKEYTDDNSTIIPQNSIEQNINLALSTLTPGETSILIAASWQYGIDRKEPNTNGWSNSMILIWKDSLVKRRAALASVGNDLNEFYPIIPFAKLSVTRIINSIDGPTSSKHNFR